ncbi:hypothetical protein CK218_12790 [Mesorhizobium sp. WSM3879]|uniref:DNA phosphorothioation-associated putative methyltransferase n=1 Tax=Mesorhizobium sp. WSM3879 TaxID=2029406 RepID=UPI000BCF9B6C|nr:DNA phosphorothioation-associated putative methyltransferase [Mesorhizobium sp. WSM3879]PBB81237.1 hypothetical protein CK218_12790 [Mesorhizobium sp. WSM3879]
MARRGEIGKQVGGFLYVHRDALPHVSEEMRQAVARAEAAASGFAWNVAKVSPERQSLLLYEDFSKSAFPALLRSLSFDADGVPSVIDYSRRDNPPILHRKETLLAPGDPRIPAFAAITRKAEEFGLFNDTKRIGTRANWTAMLAKAGLRVDGPRLAATGESAVDVAREKTAISRNGLSQPASMMIRYGMLQPGHELFDYGCGRGDDVATLQANGYFAFGWDPNFLPDGERRRADIVNLGFVINVIEDPHEREETLRAAWGFAARGMTVSVMTAGKYNIEHHTAVADGYLSRRQTFQKYFSQEDLTEMVQRATGERPIALAPGIVAAFRDKDLEQQVSFRRRSKATIYANLAIPSRDPSRFLLRPKSRPVAERASEELEAIWRTALNLGRLPQDAEVEPSVRAALEEKGIAIGRALAACAREIADPAQLKVAGDARREDLVVNFALTLFPGALKYGSLPSSIQRDIRTFFGSLAGVVDAAKAELRALRDRQVLATAYADAAATGFASYEDGIVRFLSENLEQLPVKIRIVAGCAEIVHPGFSLLDLVEIGPEPWLVRGLECDVDDSALPAIRSSVEVDLARSRSRRKTFESRVLYLKSRYLQRGHPGLEKQAAADRKLLELGIVDANGNGPPADRIAAMLAHRPGREPSTTRSPTAPTRIL